MNGVERPDRLDGKWTCRSLEYLVGHSDQLAAAREGAQPTYRRALLLRCHPAGESRTEHGSMSLGQRQR
jgi:hypothetical protein